MCSGAMENTDLHAIPDTPKSCRTARLKHMSSSSTNAPLPRLLYSRAESAYQLSLSVRAVDYLIAQGSIGTRKIGGRILIPHSELTRVARAGQIEPITSTSATATATAAKAA